MLTLISKKVSTYDNERLLCIPKEKEIEAIVLGFQAEKSLDIYGIIAKAYNRVDHIFIWDSLDAMAFDTKFMIKFIRGLVESSTSKVHFNIGLFTSRIQLQRGVKQGCSISPFLFALTTQPLMSLLSQSLLMGELVGLRIGLGKQLVQ